MLADPQSVTINGVATSLPAVARGTNTSAYANSDGTVKETISHTYGAGKSGRTRRLIRLDQNKIAADTYNPTLNTKSAQAVYLVLDNPATGFTVAEQTYLIKALVDYLSASSYAKITNFVNGES
jgi:hypothetical protein